MKNALKFAAFALLAGVALPAQAQDAPAYTGPRVELRATYDFVGAGFRNTTDFQGRGTFGDDTSNEGTNIGGEVGFDIAAGPAVVGVYAGAEFGETQILALARPYRFDTGNNYTVGARAGFQTRGVLVYAKAGYSNGELKANVLSGGSTTLFNGYDENRDGFHVGGGAEFALRGRLYGKLEYTHHRYDRATISTSEEVRFSRNNLTAAIGLRF
ncbi:outer membrane beta-barrel protein [Sphingomonas kaistensis]|uniref:Outer membrane beta-barrel protein n=1 Tax=Sphingomonas kaistensis TaxID=298708 RepID=A0ABZ2G5K8_9SPHN